MTAATATGVSPDHTYASARHPHGDADGRATARPPRQTTQSVTVTAPVPQGNQPKPGHTALVPDTARTNMPADHQR